MKASSLISEVLLSLTTATDDQFETLFLPL